MKSKSKSSLVPAAIFLTSIFLRPAAQGNTITPNPVLVPTPGLWTYSLDLTSGELQTGDGFTILDFGGYVAGSILAPAGWTASVSLLGSPFGPGLGTDLPGETNLTWTYTGAPSFQNISGPPTMFTGFSAITTSTTAVVDSWTSRDHLIGSPTVVGDGGVAPATNGSILAPAPTSVPESGWTVALFGMALVGLGGMRRKLVS